MDNVQDTKILNQLSSNGSLRSSYQLRARPLVGTHQVSVGVKRAIEIIYVETGRPEGVEKKAHIARLKTELSSDFFSYESLQCSERMDLFKGQQKIAYVGIQINYRWPKVSQSVQFCSHKSCQQAGKTFPQERHQVSGPIAQQKDLGRETGVQKNPPSGAKCPVSRYHPYERRHV